MPLKSLRGRNVWIGFLIAVFLTVAFLFIPRTFRTHEELHGARFGFPVRFIEQDLTGIDRTPPISMRFSSPWENPTRIYWGRCLADVMILGICSTLVASLVFRGKEEEEGRL